MRPLLRELKHFVAVTEAEFDLNRLVKLPRFEFIAEFLVHVTREKENRSLTQGYQIRKKGKIYQVVQTGIHAKYDGSKPKDKGVVAYETDSPDKLYDYVRRGPLMYFIRHAEELRAQAFG